MSASQKQMQMSLSKEQEQHKYYVLTVGKVMDTGVDGTSASLLTSTKAIVSNVFENTSDSVDGPGANGFFKATRRALSVSCRERRIDRNLYTVGRL